MSDYVNNLFSLAGKTALVTGGASGIGAMITQALSRAGAKVYIASRKIESLEAMAAEMTAEGGLCLPLVADISTSDGIEGLAAAISEKEGGKLDILVNNAGATWGAPIGEFPWKAWQRVMDMNVTSGFQLTQALLPQLKAAGSLEDPARVLFTGSIVGSRPVGQQTYSYSASKAAVHHLTRILSNELAADNITVNAIAPGPFLSRMTAFMYEDEDMLSEALDEVPIRRLGQADDIAGVIIPLCSKAGSYVSGAIVPVDGGISAKP